jgi:hypothetical protein
MEADEKTLQHQQNIANLIGRFFDDHLSEIKAIGFHQGGKDDSLLKWHIAAIILEKAVFNKYQGSLNIEYPKRYAGCEAFVWGEEDYRARYGNFGTCGLTNADGDLIRFLDFSINGEMAHHYFYNYQNRVNILLDAAKGQTEGFSENDILDVAELAKRGYIQKNNAVLNLKIPVFTQEQFERLLSVIDDTTTAIEEKTREMLALTTDILIQHTPVHMKKEAGNIGWLKMFDNTVTAPVKIMLDNGTLRSVAAYEHPTTYVVLK